MNVTKLYTLFLLIALSCGSPTIKKIDSKARLAEKIVPAVDAEIKQAEQQQKNLQPELAFIDGELKKLEGAANCDKENASLEPKEREEKCKLQYSFDLQERKALLLSSLQQIQAKQSVTQTASPIAQSLASGKVSQ